MDGVAILPADDRAALFEETAARARLANPVIVEKDFWVCWTLHRLYAASGMPRLLFKGGTSLSKCFGLIHRFSEDIDLGLEREDIGLGGDLDPRSRASRKGYQNAVEVLSARVKEYLVDAFVPAIRADFADTLRQFEIGLETSDAESVVLFRYPRALDGSAYGSGGYISPAVHLEIGARSDHRPTSEVEIRPYVAEQFPEEFKQPTCRVTAQAPERTLLEKALILHTSNCKGRFKQQSSRHAYDLAMMHRSGTTATVSRALYEEVAHHKLVFGDDKHASEAPDKGIRLVPEAGLLHDLEADYKAMQPMFFSEPAAPSFDDLLQNLVALEASLRSL